VFKRAKTVHALDRAATVIGDSVAAKAETPDSHKYVKVKDKRK
jgi:hypothetical protein